MKKVLSVLLAGAMMLGMSVSSFAAWSVTPAPTTAGSSLDYITIGGTGSAAPYYFSDTDVVTWPLMIVESAGAYTVYDTASEANAAALNAGDNLYIFPQLNGNFIAGTQVPSNIQVKINNAEFIDGASIEKVTPATSATNTLAKAVRKAAVELAGNTHYNVPDGITAETVDLAFVHVALEDDFDSYAEDVVKFYMYMYDGKTAEGHVYATFNFANHTYKTLYEEDLDWVIAIDKLNKVQYGKNEKAKKATIDFNELVYGEFKMYPEEKYMLNVTEKYNKTLSKEYDTDVEVITLTLTGVENLDLVFPSAEDDKQIVAVVDGELVPVEATYVEDHKFASGEKVDGYLVENVENTAFAVIDADIEVAVEEEVVETPVVEEEVKANPETGASDFVGAAVALAVVSVAAAGALALKK